MRYGCAALLMLISSAVTASAQVNVFSGSPAKAEARVSFEDMIARLMLFDKNLEGKIATNELSERMQSLVARGDKTGDGMLDATEIRHLTEAPPQVPVLFRSAQPGGYGFGDTSGSLSTRTHIENTIEDLRLAPHANEEAKRVAAAFADELEAAALANMRKSFAAVLTAEQLANLETDIKRDGAASHTFRIVATNGTAQTFVLSTTTNGNTTAIRRLGLPQPIEQLKTVTAAFETYRTDTQLDDARRAALADRLSGILTDDESDNFRAALARRPLVKATGIAGMSVALTETIRTAFPGNGVPVREIGFTTAPRPTPSVPVVASAP